MTDLNPTVFDLSQLPDYDDGRRPRVGDFVLLDGDVVAKLELVGVGKRNGNQVTA